MKYLNNFKNWKSTLIGLLIGFALFILIWFEKLPDNWITEISVILPVLIGLFTKDKKNETKG